MLGGRRRCAGLCWARWHAKEAVHEVARVAVVARDGVAGFSSGQQRAPTFFTRWVMLGTGKVQRNGFSLARPWSWERCRYRCDGLPSSSAEHAGIFQQEQDFEQQSPGARYPDASPLGTVRCDALRIFDRPGTGDGTVATEAPERDNSSLLREKESAREPPFTWSAP